MPPLTVSPSLSVPCSAPLHKESGGLLRFFSRPRPKEHRVRDMLSPPSPFGAHCSVVTAHLVQAASLSPPVSEFFIQKALLILKFTSTPKSQGTYINSPKNCQVPQTDLLISSPDRFLYGRHPQPQGPGRVPVQGL